MTKTIVITAIIFVIVGLVIAMNIFSSTSGQLTESAYTISEANNCSDFTGWTYNRSSGNCNNDSNGAEQASGSETLPLATLFSPSGITMLVFMASLFLLLIGFIIVKTRFKG